MVCWLSAVAINFYACFNAGCKSGSDTCFFNFLRLVVLLELLTFALATQQSHLAGNSPSFKYYANPPLTKVVEMYKNDCHVFTNSDALWINKTRPFVTRLNSVQFELLLEKCYPNHLLEPEGGSSNQNGTVVLVPTMEDFNMTLNGMNTTDLFNSTDGGATPIIYPGTKWCGRGDVARNYDDLGVYTHTDECCRDHDNCPDNIAAGAERHGLRNRASFTSSHCKCDDKFLNCLRNDRTFSQLTSAKIAHIYFNILKPLCFDERHPVTTCQRKRLTGECVTPEYNYREGRQWQFFAAQPYFAKTVRGLLDTLNTVLGPTDSPVADASSQSGRRALSMPPGFTF